MDRIYVLCQTELSNWSVLVFVAWFFPNYEAENQHRENNSREPEKFIYTLASFGAGCCFDVSNVSALKMAGVKKN